MADKITTLQLKADPDIKIYPNVKDENIPNTIARQSDLDEAKADIAKNKDGIATNKDGIATNKANIDANRISIFSNTQDIRTNQGIIANHDTDITQNKADIATNSTDILTNRSGINQNKTNIATNKTNIDTNRANIAANKLLIDDLSNKVTTKDVEADSGTIASLHATDFELGSKSDGSPLIHNDSNNLVQIDNVENIKFGNSSIVFDTLGEGDGISLSTTQSSLGLTKSATLSNTGGEIGITENRGPYLSDRENHKVYLPHLTANDTFVLESTIKHIYTHVINISCDLNEQGTNNVFIIFSIDVEFPNQILFYDLEALMENKVLIPASGYARIDQKYEAIYSISINRTLHQITFYTIKQANVSIGLDFPNFVIKDNAIRQII